jgi:two-component system LytT family response regulator
MKVLVIENEWLGAQALVQLLAQTDPGIEVLAIKDSIHSAAAWLKGHPPPHLIFMDIELADGQCFELFREVEIQSPVIFTTSYDEHALQAFQYNGIDYLLKPIAAEALQRSLHKVRQLTLQLSRKAHPTPDWEALMHQLGAHWPSPEYRDRFLVKQGQRLLSVSLTNTAYFYSKGKVTFLKCVDGKEYYMDYSLDQLVPLLPPQKFYRLNRQVIASHASISQVHSWINGKLKVDLTPVMEEEVVVSRDKAKAFRYWMGK